MRVRRVVTIVVVLAAVAGIGVYLTLHRLAPKLPEVLGRACEVRTAGGTVALNADQMANAATIAAVGARRQVPDRAVVVALATAFQESKIRNLDSGDRDSIGLFQQRPSQGWGTPAQLRDPRYAANGFYSSLLRVRGWEQMRVTEAAQRVQRSAYPEAYEKWVDEATVLSEALLGNASGAVSCTAAPPPRRGADAARALTTGLRLDWGDIPTIATSEVLSLVLAADDDRAGWRYAHWLVAHSQLSGIRMVRFGNREWTASGAEWRPVDATGGAAGERVIAEVYG